MKNSYRPQSFLVLCSLLTLAFPVRGQETVMPKEVEEARTDAYAAQLENYLREYLVDAYEARAADAWHRDYSSIDAFIRSVEPNRKRWKAVVKPPVLRKSGPLTRKSHTYLKDIQAEWLELPLGPISAQAILVLPRGASQNKPVPLVIAQHGIGSFPEVTFGGHIESYNAYARNLLDAGFAVLAPMNLRSVERRNHLERLCRLADTSLPGIELVRLQNLLDVVLADSRIDAGRVGMWGVSLGGMATMFFMPLEPRIKAGVVAAWFNHRRNKMVIPDDRYTSFLPTKEEHAFFAGWLSEFSDHDAVSLICPRPLLIQHGKKDRIAHWPQVIEEFNIAKTHYKKLNIEDRIQLNVHEGGHEPVVDNGIAFLSKWLRPDAAGKKKK